eukprot:7383101-Prymnesium_polylepis.1
MTDRSDEECGERRRRSFVAAVAVAPSASRRFISVLAWMMRCARIGPLYFGAPHDLTPPHPTHTHTHRAHSHTHTPAHPHTTRYTTPTRHGGECARVISWFGGTLASALWVYQRGSGVLVAASVPTLCRVYLRVRALLGLAD